MPFVQIGKALNPVRVDNLSGGYLPSKSLETLRPNEWQTLTNWDQTLDGDLATRDGRTSFSAVGNVRSLFRWTNPSGTRDWIGFTSAGDIYANGTLGLGGFAHAWYNLRVSWAPFLGKLYLTNHGGNIYYWDGSVVGGPVTTTITSVKLVAAHKGRLWAADATGASNPTKGILYYSSVGDATAWDTSTGWFDLGANDGGEIQGIVSTLGGLVALKSNGLWVIYGSDPTDSTGDMREERLYKDVGAVSEAAIVPVGQEIYFLSEEGFFKFSNGSLSDFGVPVWKGDFKPLLSVAASEESGRSTLWKTVGAKVGREIWFSVSSDGTNMDRLYVFSLVNGTWRRFDGLDIAALCSPADDLDLTGALLADATGVYTIGGTSDNSAAIHATAKTKPYDHGEPDLVKQYPEIGVRATVPVGGTLTVTWECDRGARTGTKTITATGWHRLRLPSTAWGQDISLQFETNDALGQYKVQAFEIRAHGKRWANVG